MEGVLGDGVARGRGLLGEGKPKVNNYQVNTFPYIGDGSFWTNKIYSYI